MLLKLLKYDFRAMWKQFSLIWGAALVLALVNRFVLFQDVDSALLRQAGLFMFGRDRGHVRHCDYLCGQPFFQRPAGQ